MSFWKQHRLTIAMIAPLLAFFGLGWLFTTWYPYQVNSIDVGSGTVGSGTVGSGTVGSGTVGSDTIRSIDGPRYLVLVAARVILIGAILFGFARLILKSFPWSVDRWGVIVGLVGGAVWIGACHLQAEAWIMSLLGGSDQTLASRDAVNPFLLFPDPLQRSVFLVLRFTLLVMAIPIAEELFLRGWLMRAVDSQDWQQLPLAQIGSAGLITGTLYGVLSHPSEALAAAIWFSMITVLVVKTGRFWNAVIAHAITNAILGIYICWTANWQWW